MRKNDNILVSKITGDQYIVKEIRVEDKCGREFSIPIDFAKRNLMPKKEYDKEQLKPVMKKLKHRM